MGLEIGTYIDDLVTTNPLGTDGKSQGDDHIRLIKSVLQNTFPNANRAFNLTQAAEFKDETVTITIDTPLDGSELGRLYRIDASSGNVTLTLPDPTTQALAGWMLLVKRADAAQGNEARITSAGSATIDGEVEYLLSRQRETVALRSDGTNWHIVAAYLSDLFSAGETVTSDRTVKVADYGKALLVDASGGDVTITLEEASELTSEFFIRILRIDGSANTVTIARSGGDLINGEASLLLGRQYDWATPQSDGTNWFAMTSIAPSAPFSAGYCRGFIPRNSPVDTANDIIFDGGRMRDVADTLNIVTAASLTKQADAPWLKGDSVGGLFSHSIAVFAADTTYHFFVIRENSTGDIDYGFDTDPAGVNAPGGWTVLRRILSMRTQTNAAAWREFFIEGAEINSKLEGKIRVRYKNLSAATDSSDANAVGTDCTVGLTTDPLAAFTVNFCPDDVSVGLFGTLRSDQSGNSPIQTGLYPFEMIGISDTVISWAYERDTAGSGGQQRRMRYFENLWTNTSRQIKAHEQNTQVFYLHGWDDFRQTNE